MQPVFKIDPVDEILALARRLKQDDNLRIINVCEEQFASTASIILRTACQRGSWVIIKNCHLASQWPTNVIDIFHVSTNRDCRITAGMSCHARTSHLRCYHYCLFSTCSRGGKYFMN